MFSCSREVKLSIFWWFDNINSNLDCESVLVHEDFKTKIQCNQYDCTTEIWLTHYFSFPISRNIEIFQKFAKGKGECPTQTLIIGQRNLCSLVYWT